MSKSWLGCLVIAALLVGCGSAGDSGYGAAPMGDVASDGEASPDDSGAEEPEPLEQKPGQLTAAEWRDLDAWEFWVDLHDRPKTGIPDAHAEWGIETRDRVRVAVTTASGPVTDARVKLLDDRGTILWSARTNLDGEAELFAAPFDGDDGVPAAILVSANGELAQLPFDEDELEVKVRLEQAAAPPSAVDVMFFVDTTGSMGDELAYVQSEIVSVIQAAEADAPRGVDFRVAAGVYRDEGDAYVSRSVDFSDDAQDAADFLAQQASDGGGDFPEAVDRALADAMSEVKWSESARSRILFLVLDAPPHADKIEKVRNSIREAASIGVRIIVVAGSGIDRPTEYLGRSMGILTGGTYVFLTDDSGIGESHLVPVVGRYKVEYLNTLLTRLILESAVPTTAAP